MVPSCRIRAIAQPAPRRLFPCTNTPGGESHPQTRHGYPPDPFYSWKKYAPQRARWSAARPGRRSPIREPDTVRRDLSEKPEIQRNHPGAPVVSEVGPGVTGVHPGPVSNVVRAPPPSGDCVVDHWNL